MDFFAAGGDSLGLLQLVVGIEQEFGCRFPISVVLEAPTLKKLAARLDKEQDSLQFKERGERQDAGPEPARDEALSPPDDNRVLRLAVVPIRSSGSRTPLFLVAPAGATLLPYYRLAHGLGPEQPVYGLQVNPPSFRNTRGFDIEPMAAGLIPLMRAVQPEGPYRLGGWSFGGFVAWEMARQLGEAGVRVDRMVIADSDFSMSDTSSSLKAIVRGLWIGVLGLRHSKPLLRDNLHLRLADKMRPDTEKKPGMLSRLAWRAGLRKAPISDLIASDSRLELLKESPLSILQNYRAYCLAIRRYKPRPLDLEIDLVLPEHPGMTISGDTEEAIAEGWGNMSKGRIRIHRVPGNHFTLFYPPAVDDMARKLGERLTPRAGVVVQRDLAANTSSGEDRNSVHTRWTTSPPRIS
jgi:thioesterase domain-containing protein